MANFNELLLDPVNGSNMNGGYPAAGGIYPKTYTNGAWNGSSTFTPSGGANPQADGIQVGDSAGIYADGATTPVYLDRIGVVTTTAITLDGRFSVGAAPGALGSGMTCRVGGELKGPNAAQIWPFNGALTAINPRVSLRSNGSFVISATVAFAASWQRVRVEGYTNSPGDGGRAKIDGNANAITLLSGAGATNYLKNIEFVNAASTGTNDGLSVSGLNWTFENIIVHGMRGRGFNTSATGHLYIGCEAYGNNTSNTANFGGFVTSVSTTYKRCIAHDHSAGANGHGFVFTGGLGNMGTYETCRSESNAGAGLFLSNAGKVYVDASDFWTNNTSGIDAQNAQAIVITHNSNYLKNTVAGVKLHGSGLCPQEINSCGFGSGTQANGTNVTTDPSMTTSNLVNYAADVTPWSDPANGNFSIVLAAAKGTGLGSFTETAASYGGTVGYPDIGSAQHQDSGGLLVHPGMEGF